MGAEPSKLNVFQNTQVSTLKKTDTKLETCWRLYLACSSPENFKNVASWLGSGLKLTHSPSMEMSEHCLGQEGKSLRSSRFSAWRTTTGKPQDNYATIDTCGDQRGTLGVHSLPYSPAQDLPLKLALDWHPASPSQPPVSVSHNTGVTGVTCVTTPNLLCRYRRLEFRSPHLHKHSTTELSPRPFDFSEHIRGLHFCALKLGLWEG